MMKQQHNIRVAAVTFVNTDLDVIGKEAPADLTARGTSNRTARTLQQTLRLKR